MTTRPNITESTRQSLRRELVDKLIWPTQDPYDVSIFAIAEARVKREKATGVSNPALYTLADLAALGKLRDIQTLLHRRDASLGIPGESRETPAKRAQKALEERAARDPEIRDLLALARNKDRDLLAYAGPERPTDKQLLEFRRLMGDYVKDVPPQVVLKMCILENPQSQAAQGFFPNRFLDHLINSGSAALNGKLNDHASQIWEIIERISSSSSEAAVLPRLQGRRREHALVPLRGAIAPDRDPQGTARTLPMHKPPGVRKGAAVTAKGFRPPHAVDGRDNGRSRS